MPYFFVSLLFITLSATGCAAKVQVPIEPSYALADTQATRLGAGIAKVAQRHAQPSGFYLLSNGLDAFVTRLLLMEAAEASLDVQYYLFHDDTTSKLFTYYLLRAADRGVRVRLLLDDFGHAGQEELLSALAQHPNISVRLFNPFTNRRLPYVDFITRFSVAHRRMHNKSFIADNQAAIIGGRNIGNTYFAADEYTHFADLDVLGVGLFASEVSDAFDVYWNHSLSIPVQQFADAPSSALVSARYQLVKARETETSRAYLARLEVLQLIEELKRGELSMYWAESDLIYDAPDKILNPSKDTNGHMAPALKKLLGDAHSEALIVSPYFVPGKKGVASLARWVSEGAEVTVLTNSLAANDVPLVHSGYAKYRRPLIEAGVNLWELQPRGKQTKRNKDAIGSSKASLHAKTMILDRNTLFVGSMNLDPRSVNLNTEIGVLIYSQPLAEFASDAFLAELPAHAWRLDIHSNVDEESRSKQLVWLNEFHQPATIISFKSEPESTRWRRFQVWFYRFLPLESML